MQGLDPYFFMGKDIGKTETHKGWPTKGNRSIDEGTYVGKKVVFRIDVKNASKESPQSHGSDKIQKVFECRNMRSPIST